MTTIPPRFLIAAALLLASLPALALEPFVATYQAYNGGKLAGSATMTVSAEPDNRWQVDLDIRGTRGFARLAGLNIKQTTVFDSHHDIYRPLGQSTIRRALFSGRDNQGIYDWHSMTARWQGDIKESRTRPVPLHAGDVSALLMNLAVIRDAEPGKTLHYRVVDNGRARDHEYRVSELNEIVQVEELSYDAMRVARTNGGNDEIILWVANGVPTPVRILQRENGQDAIDLRLVEYQ